MYKAFDFIIKYFQKNDRKILLKNLTGSSAFKNGAKKEASNDEISK